MKRHFQKFHASERSDGPSGTRIDPTLSTSDSDKGVDPQQPIRLQHYRLTFHDVQWDIKSAALFVYFYAERFVA